MKWISRKMWMRRGRKLTANEFREGLVQILMSIQQGTQVMALTYQDIVAKMASVATELDTYQAKQGLLIQLLQHVSQQLKDLQATGGATPDELQQVFETADGLLTTIKGDEAKVDEAIAANTEPANAPPVVNPLPVPGEPPAPPDASAPAPAPSVQGSADGSAPPVSSGAPGA